MRNRRKALLTPALTRGWKMRSIYRRGMGAVRAPIAALGSGSRVAVTCTKWEMARVPKLPT